MKKISLKDQLIIPVYLNEKTVLDMLAVIEDGFSMISEVSSSNQNNNTSDIKVSGGLAANALLNKLLKIEINPNYEQQKSNNTIDETKSEKVHTNVSLLSKFRSELINNQLLSCSADNELDISKIKTGDFIEIEGELQKNPIIDLIEKLMDASQMIDVFTEKEGPASNTKKVKSNSKTNNNPIKQQIKALLENLTHSGTVDFILENPKGTLVLSTQKQYLANDNISEIIGGRFKVLGKVIKICKTSEESINLLRKTPLYILNKDDLNNLWLALNASELKQFNLPILKYEIPGPSVIIIPVAIYA